jgi:hypothetical protein
MGYKEEEKTQGEGLLYYFVGENLVVCTVMKSRGYEKQSDSTYFRDKSCKACYWVKVQRKGKK